MDIVDFLTTNRALILQISSIVIGALLITHFGEVFVRKAVVRSVRSGRHKSTIEEQKREKTIVRIIAGGIRILVWPMAIILIIDQLGVEVGPLIAGAGIAGVALGFGAQSLVKDVIAGLFIIIENQYGVGDVVDLGGTSGLVEDINLRKTTLRDLDGIVHHIPNGTIERASNLTSEFSGINLDVGVSYSSDLDQVITVVNEVGQALAKDTQWREDIVEKPEFLRVDNFADSAIVIKITGRTKPLRQWDVTGELRKRLKIAFDTHGIEIPFPQRVIHQAPASNRKK